MSFAKPTTLGVIACPGGTNFAREIIAHLKTIYKGRFDKKARFISKLYNMSMEETYQELNKADDLLSHRTIEVGNAEDYREPSFQIPCKFTRFANGEFKTEIQRSVRAKDIYIVQDVTNNLPVDFADKQWSCTVNDHFMTLLTTIDAVFQAGARRISLVLPTYPYSRQHKINGREGLTASVVGRIFEDMGVARIITLDIHSREITHCFRRLSLENLHASYQILRTAIEVLDVVDEDVVIVSPDTGAIDRNKFYSASLKKPLAMLYKERDYRRTSRNASETNITTTRLLGNVDGKTVFMADDMLGTGGTIIKAMKVLKEMGARRIISSVSLPFFLENAEEHLNNAHEKGLFDYFIGTNAVHLSEKITEQKWYRSADVSSLFARVVSRVHHNRPVSPLLDNSALIQQLVEKQRRNTGLGLFHNS